MCINSQSDDVGDVKSHGNNSNFNPQKAVFNNGLTEKYKLLKINFECIINFMRNQSQLLS